MAEPPRSVGLLLLPDFSQLGLAAITEPLFVANWLSGRDLYRWHTLSLDGRPARSSAGQRLPVESGIAEMSRFDMLLVLASFDVKRLTRDHALKSWLRRVARHGATIGSIETASEVVAAAGLLDGLPVAVHWDNLQGFAESHPRCRAVLQLYTFEGDRLTCAGQSSTIDMMLEWISQDQNLALAQEIAAHLMLPAWRKGEAPQPAPGLGADRIADPLLERVVGIMERNIEEPLSCARIARQAGITMRRMQRLFARSLGTSPVRHYQFIRLTKAHALLQQTDLSVTEISVSAGFSSLEHFCRTYRRQFGCRPRDDRRQSVTAPVLRRPSRVALK
jgi:AraC family carnitine catabolism transcriptional activator